MTLHIAQRHVTALAIGLSLVCMPVAAGDVDTRSPHAVISAVWVAATNRDIEALRPHMSEAFVYNFGDDPSREQALEQFRKNPQLFDALASAISARCRPETQDKDKPGEVRDYICPQWFGRGLTKGVPQKPVYRAGFVKGKDGVWRMEYFVTGD